MLNDLLVNLIWMITTFILGWLYQLFKEKSKRRMNRKLLRMVEDEQKIVCFTANPLQHDDEEFVDLGYVFEYLSVGEISASFRQMYKKLECECVMSKINPEDNQLGLQKENMILIGGPFHNSLTKKLIFEEWIPPFSFDSDANLIYDTDIYKPVLTQSSNPHFGKDFAVILNMKNPYHLERRLICIMGCRSIGCYGATVFLTRYLDTIKDKIVDEEYAIVISCRGEEEKLVTKPNFEKYYKIERSKGA